MTALKLHHPFAPGTRIYYTGDCANHEGFGAVVAYEPPGRWSAQIQVRLDDGREFWVSPTAFENSPGRRFWLESEWRADRQRRIAEAEKLYQAILDKR